MDKRQELKQMIINAKLTEKQLDLIIDKVKEILKAQNKPQNCPLKPQKTKGSIFY